MRVMRNPARPWRSIRLPSEEFLDGERVAAAGLYKRKEPTAHRCNDYGLAANDPVLRPRYREIGNCKLAAIWPADILEPRAVGLGHVTLMHGHKNTNSLGRMYSV